MSTPSACPTIGIHPGLPGGGFERQERALMGIVQNLSVLALKQAVHGACQALGMEAVGKGADAVIGSSSNASPMAANI